MGDPAGIGPETIVGAWPDPRIHQNCQPLVLGNRAVIQRAVKLRRTKLEVIEVAHADEALPRQDLIPCLPVGAADAALVAAATHDPRGGQAAFDAVSVAADLALAGQVDGIVTAPLNKASLQAAGHDYPGHTELLAHLCGVPRTAMMLYLPPSETILGPTGLGVVHVTLHIALRDVCDAICAEEIVACAQLADDVMRRLAEATSPPPRLGVCALNPHAGEHGLFGDEEQTVIAPAVRQICEAGINAWGPFPADTVMMRARAGEFDAVVAMYHDQGHIALKLLGMHSAVNITLGLPIIRTSVAYGTAFDRAWQGTADCGGMVEAIQVAVRLARNRTASKTRVSSSINPLCR